MGKGILLAGVLGYVALNFAYFESNKHAALNRALELTDQKGIINLGSGYGRTSFSTLVCELPEVVLNVDKNEAGPKFQQVNLEEPLPFTDSQFDVAFASHVLEHITNWEAALNEWVRIADHVIITLPSPFDLSNIFHPDHKNLFTFGDANYIRTNWGVEIFI